jgi:hypothetical protein
MANSSTFEWLCDNLETATDFDRLEARGTIRIALKRAGLEAKSLTPDHARVVLEKLIPGELEARGVSDPARTCSNLVRRLDAIPASKADSSATTPEEIFARLA